MILGKSICNEKGKNLDSEHGKGRVVLFSVQWSETVVLELTFDHLKLIVERNPVT